MLRPITLILLFALLLPPPFVANADDVPSDAEFAAEQAAWLTESAAPYLAGEHLGLPLYRAQVMEALPSHKEYLERENWCSYYCCAPELRLSSSSELEGSASLHYGADMADDYDLATAWVEGSSGPGIGESIAFQLITMAESEEGVPFAQQYLNGLEIVNGYAKSADLYSANGCPLLLKLWFNDAPVCCIELLDSMDIQEVSFAPLYLTSEHNCELRLEILSVRAGAKYEDTAISEIMLRGGPCH